MYTVGGHSLKAIPCPREAGLGAWTWEEPGPQQVDRGERAPSVHLSVHSSPWGLWMCPARGGHFQPQPPSLSPGPSLVGAIILILTTEQLGLGDMNKQLQVSLSDRTQQTGWAGGWGRWDEKERGLSVSFQLSQRLESRRSTSPQITCYRGRRRSSCPTSPLQCRPHLGTSHRATMGHPRPPYVMAPGPAF